MDSSKTNKAISGKIKFKKSIFIWVIIIFTVLLGACSPKIKTSVLNFIFDGVPSRKINDSSAVSAKVIIDSSKTNAKATVQTTTEVGPILYYHTPYKERACIKCHSTELPGTITIAQDEICFSCHENFQKKYPFIHGPVAGGFCTTCHAPHFSENKKLLKRIGQNLCLNCHEAEQIMTNKAHLEIGNTSCTECHNPHGGSDHNILKLAKS